MTAIRSSRDVRKDDKIILIMGPTGSGKSNLIDTLTQETKWSGDSLRSVTQNVRAIRVRSSLPGTAEEIVLVDTPSLDDTTRPDLVTLRMIADWLNETYGRGIKLTGILYLHRISDRQMSGYVHRNFRTFGKLCGSDAAKILIFVTTMWDRTDPKRSEPRENDLKIRYFKPMLDLGAHTARFTNTYDSAWKIIFQLLSLGEEQTATQIQEEMVDMRMELAETKAAAEVLTDLQRLLTDHKQTVEALKREAEKANNQEMIVSLNRDLADIQKRMEKTLGEAQELEIPFSTRIKRFFGSKPKDKSVEPSI